jgi:hypothetical protein
MPEPTARPRIRSGLWIFPAMHCKRQQHSSCSQPRDHRALRLTSTVKVATDEYSSRFPWNRIHRSCPLCRLSREKIIELPVYVSMAVETRCPKGQQDFPECHCGSFVYLITIRMMAGFPEFPTVRGAQVKVALRVHSNALFLAIFPSNALARQSLVVSNGWCME